MNCCKLIVETEEEERGKNLNCGNLIATITNSILATQLQLTYKAFMNRLSAKKKKIIEPIHRLHGYHFNIEVNEKKRRSKMQSCKYSYSLCER